MGNRITPDSFPALFDSESLLQQAIAGLLSKMPDTSGVQILQGTQEFGKDIVFYHRGAFSEKTLCACVVKNTKITGSVDSNHGARTVYLQAEQARDTPHYDENGNEVRVHKIYILTPHSIPPATVHSIRGKLSASDGTIQFISGPDLFDLFRNFWPDFLVDEFAAIQQYLATEEVGLAEDRAISDVAFAYGIGKIDRDARKIYVTPNFNRTVYSYSLTPPLDGDFLETFRKGLRTASKRASTPIPSITQVSRYWAGFSAALSTLAAWGLVSPKDVPRLRKAWRTLSEKYAQFEALLQAFEEDPDHSEEYFDKGVLGTREQYCEELIALAEAFEEQRLAAIEPLLETLRGTRESLPPSDAKPIEILGDRCFGTASAISDMCSITPMAVLQAGPAVRYDFTAGCFDEWGPSVLIVGPAGYGKTSFCRFHALEDAARFTAGSSGIVPLYVPLHLYSQGYQDTLGEPEAKDSRSFEASLLRLLGRSALLQGRNLNDESRVRVYLDGLDEVPDGVRRQQISRMAQDVSASSSRFQIVITARDYVVDESLSWLPRVHLSGFTMDQVTQLAGMWLGDEEAARFFEQVERTPGIIALMSTPLLATLVILVYGQTRKLPGSTARLYSMFVDLLCGGWDLAKRVQRGSQIGSDVKRQILRIAAHRAHLNQHRQFDERVIKSSVEDFMVKEYAKKWELIRDEVVQDSLVVSVSGKLEFSHLSFQEYLCAEYLSADPMGDRAKYALREYLSGNDWWKEVMRLYIGIAGDPIEVWHSFRVAGLSGDPSRIDFLKDSIRQLHPDSRLPFE